MVPILASATANYCRARKVFTHDRFTLPPWVRQQNEGAVRLCKKEIPMGLEFLIGIAVLVVAVGSKIVVKGNSITINIGNSSRD